MVPGLFLSGFNTEYKRCLNKWYKLSPRYVAHCPRKANWKETKVQTKYIFLQPQVNCHPPTENQIQWLPRKLVESWSPREYESSASQGQEKRERCSKMLSRLFLVPDHVSFSELGTMVAGRFALLTEVLEQMNAP